MYGANALEWRRKFIGLLPEINRRKLFLKQNCQSIFEFAAKWGGVSHAQVRLTLNLSKSFKNRPTLKRLLETGEVSVNKLVRVRSISTPDNETFWAEKAQIMSRRTLATMVRDEKLHDAPQSLAGQDLDLSPEIKARLGHLQESGVNINELLAQLLDQHEHEKREIGEASKETRSRYVPVKVRKILKREYGGDCAMPRCARPAEEIDHIIPFSMIRRHDPRLMRPLCKSHHQIAHSVDLKSHQKRFEVMLR